MAPSPNRARSVSSCASDAFASVDAAMAWTRSRRFNAGDPSSVAKALPVL